MEAGVPVVPARMYWATDMELVRKQAAEVAIRFMLKAILGGLVDRADASPIDNEDELKEKF